MTRVLAVDDHPLFRAGLVAALSSSDLLTLVGAAGSVAEARELAAALRPEVIVLDIALPDGSGLSLVPELSALARVIVLSVHDEASHRRRAREAGAAAFLAKSCAPETVTAAVVAIAGGAGFIAAPAEPVCADRPLPPGLAEGLEQLSASEARILELLGENRTSRQIAARLHVSVRTVQNHRASICRKLGLRGSHALLELALALRARA